MMKWLNKWRIRCREGLIVFGLFLLLSLVLTYPLVTKLTTHVVGRNIDDGIFIWNLWWVKHAIVDLHTSPFFTDYIFYPLGISLVYYTLTMFNGLVAVPLQLVMSPITANNVIFLLSLTLAGCGTYWLVKDLLEHELFPGPLSPWEGVDLPLAADRPSPRLSPWEREGVDPRPGTPLSREKGKVVCFAGFVAGVIFAFPASRFVYAAYGQANLTSVEWLPFFALFFLRALRDAFEAREETDGLPAHRRFAAVSTFKNAILAGLFFVLATYTEMTFAVFLLLFALVAVLVKAPFGAPRRLLCGGAHLAIMGLTALGGLSPLLFLVWRESSQGAYSSSGWGYADAFSSDLLGFFLPTYLHPIFGSGAAALTAAFTDPNIVFLGYATLGLSILGAIVYWRRLRLWGYAALTFAVLCLGPVLHVNGVADFDFDGLRASIPLPFLLLHYLPLVKANRTPNRFVVMLMLCLAVLAGFAVYWLLLRLLPRHPASNPRYGLPRGRRQARVLRDWVVGSTRSALRRGTVMSTFAGFVILAAVFFEHLSIPLPLNEARAPAIYEQIGQEKDDFAILQLPLGWRNSYGVLGYERTIIQSYQAVHSKRMLAGNTSRNPDFKFGYFSQVPVLKTIIAMEQEGKFDVAVTPTDRDMARRVVALYDIRYLVVHRQYIDPRVESYARQVFDLEKISEEGDVVAYRVRPPPAEDELLVDLGVPESWMYRGEGWSEDETLAGGVTANWVSGPAARLFFPASGEKEMIARLRVIAVTGGGMPLPDLGIEVNGHRLASLSLTDKWQEHQVDIPTQVQRQGLNEMRLRPKSENKGRVAAIDYVEFEVK